MEAKTKTEIVKEAIEWAAKRGTDGDLKDVIVCLYKARKDLEEVYKIARADLEEERAERKKVTEALQDRIRNEANRPTKRITELKEEIEKLKADNEWLESQIAGWRESNEGQAELIRKLKEELEIQIDRAERAEKEIRAAKAMHTMDMIDAEIDARRYDDETVITINRKPQEIINVSILFANANEEEEEDHGEN